MASVSMPATVSSITTPFTNTCHLSTPSVSAHNRRKSRDPGSIPLPTFSFNPAADEAVENIESENQNPGEDMIKNGGHTRRVSRPPPLPEFSFNPGATIPVEDRSSPTHPVLEEMALNQQRVSRSAKPAPLPAFTFSPGASTHTSPSPTRSEFGDSAHARPAGGHKRAGSEFVGGSAEGPTMISTSPAKPTGPPVAGSSRRGHIHRRSQAISITDIDTSDLIKAHAVSRARTTSQPSTPSEAPLDFLAGPQSPSRQSISARSPPASPRRRESATGPRPRVEFAEKIDVIPRPLSLISSETEGSTSTIRFGHSLNNSINSIASPARATSTLSSPSIEQSTFQQRPKTADAATMLFARHSSQDQSLSVPTLPKRPLSASGSPAMLNTENHPIKKKHFWFSHSPDRTPTGTPRDEISDPFGSLPNFAHLPPTDKARPKTSPERSASSMRKKKHHVWTASIFAKKPKSRTTKSKAKRSATPPTLQRRASDMVNEIFDADDTVVLRSESPELQRARMTIEPHAPSSPAPGTLEEVMSPVLDLDAALGPFGSDARFGGEQGQRTAASRIAKLHSSERRGVMDAFGTVHRRTESAPSMPAFNRSTYGQTRDGSNTSLVEDVFDEEEEDIFLAGENKTPIKSHERPDPDATPTGPQRVTTKVDDRPVGGLGLSNLSGSDDAVVILDPEQEVVNTDLDSSKSTLEAPLIAHMDLNKRPMSSPMSFAYPSTQSHYASSTEGRTTTSASMISSPDPDHIHFDNIPSLSRGMGEQSPEFYLRPSNDDLPSLSDSISSTALPRASSSGNWFEEHRDQRSASMFVPGSSRSSQSWKRSSLATLNRLIPGSANGSKLKFETTPDYASEDRSQKKTKRLSKLLNFLRPKDKIEG